MGSSLGEAYYYINTLFEIGFIKLKNFSKPNYKQGYPCVVTPMSIKEKTKSMKKNCAKRNNLSSRNYIIT